MNSSGCDVWDVRMVHVLARQPAASPQQWRDMVLTAEALEQLWTQALSTYHSDMASCVHCTLQ